MQFASTLVVVANLIVGRCMAHLLLLEESGRMLWLALATAASSSMTKALVMVAAAPPCDAFSCGLDLGRMALPTLHCQCTSCLGKDLRQPVG